MRTIIIRDPTNPEEINRSKKYFLMRAKGSFRRHSGCERAWSSGHSWSVLDLKMQQFHHGYGQDCKTCNESVKLVYPKDSVEKMARWACQNYKSRTGVEPIMYRISSTLGARTSSRYARCVRCFVVNVGNKINNN